MPRVKLSANEMKKRKDNVYSYHPKHRINCAEPVWKRWLILKDFLNISRPSNLLMLLIDTWYESKGIIESEVRDLKPCVQNRNDADTGFDNLTTNGNDWPTVEIKTEIEAESSCAGRQNILSSNDDNIDLSSKAKLSDFGDVDNDEVEPGNEQENGIGETLDDITENGTEKYGKNDIIETDADKSYLTDRHEPPCSAKSIREDVNKQASNHPPEKRPLDSEDMPIKKKWKKKCVKRIDKKSASWIKIKLDDHQNKYTVEMLESLERKNRRSTVTEQLYSCLICKHFKCASRDVFEDHIESHINKALECEKCSYTSFSEFDIVKHKQNCGQISKGKYVCDVCGVFIQSSETRRHHMGKAHNIAEFQCRYCPETLLSRLDRLHHMRDFHPVLCQFCNKCKKSKWQLCKEDFEQHLENCSGTKQCQICGTILNLPVYYQHMASHTRVRKHQCHLCSYAFLTTAKLESHILTHTNIHPHSCDQCAFTCVQGTQLKSHMRTHTGEKPYKCTQCKYAAAWNVQLKDHVKAHSMEMAVTCQQCDVMFKSDKTLNMHIKKEHC